MIKKEDFGSFLQVLLDCAVMKLVWEENME